MKESGQMAYEAFCSREGMVCAPWSSLLVGSKELWATVESAIRADEAAKVREECAKVADSFLTKADAKFDGVIKSARRGQKNMELAAAAAVGMSHDARQIAAAIRALGEKQDG
jgi:hypothetical protein